MTNCPNCGAPIKGSICEYCGTRFDLDQKTAIPQINIIREDRPCDILGATTTISKEWITRGDEIEQISKIAVDILANDLAKTLKNYMNLEVEYEPMEQAYKVRSRVRVIRPEYKFY